jgi:hypothetical protein
VSTVDEPVIVVTSPRCPRPRRIALADAVIALGSHRSARELFDSYPGLTLAVVRDSSGGVTIAFPDADLPPESLGTVVRLLYAWRASHPLDHPGQPAANL